MKLEDEFSNENIKSYAKVCVNIAEYMPLYDFDTLLLPSRGAIPIFLGALYGLKYLKGKDKEHWNLLGRLTAPKVIQKGILPKGDIGEVNNEKIRVLPYPFTADLSLNRFYPNADNNYYTDMVRKFGAKVIRSFFKEPEEKIEDKYFKFFIKILEDIEDRKDLAKSYIAYPKIKNMAMIDTIISGRAVSTILEALGDEGIFPQTFLVVDKNGMKVRDDYGKLLGYNLPRNIINNEPKPIVHREIKCNTKIKKMHQEIQIDRRKNEFFKVNRIVTEDRGCAFQGVSAVVYPDIIVEGSSKVGNNLYEVGAGTWYELTKEKKHRKVFYKFINTLKTAIALYCVEEKGVKGNTEKLEQEFERRRQNLVGILNETELPRITKENLKTYYPNYNMELIHDVYDEAKAEVVHLLLKKDYAMQFLDSFKESLEEKILK